jgi:hypothetical protein
MSSLIIISQYDPENIFVPPQFTLQMPHEGVAKKFGKNRNQNTIYSY